VWAGAAGGREGHSPALLLELEKKAEGKKRKVLRLGSGYVSRPVAEYIIRDPRNELVIGELGCQFWR
jgi:spermidine synthase / saccharopine dehydrogenase (NADP+, L-glutamate-forming)